MMRRRSRSFEASRGRVERLFWQSGGGFVRNIVEPRTLMAMIDCIHMNPVRRGLVERPTDWKWSSAGWYAGVNRGGAEPHCGCLRGEAVRGLSGDSKTDPLEPRLTYTPIIHW